MWGFRFEFISLYERTIIQINVNNLGEQLKA